MGERTHFVHHFGKRVNEWRRFVLVSLKRVNEMGRTVNEMNRFVGRSGRFVKHFVKRVGEMPNPIGWFTEIVNGMHYFVDEMDYFVQSSRRFAELFSDQMDRFCSISGRLVALQALPHQQVWHAARFPGDGLKMAGCGRFRRALLGMGPLPAVRKPGQQLQQPGLRALFLQP